MCTPVHMHNARILKNRTDTMCVYDFAGILYMQRLDIRYNSMKWKVKFFFIVLYFIHCFPFRFMQWLSMSATIILPISDRQNKSAHKYLQDNNNNNNSNVGTSTQLLLHLHLFDCSVRLNSFVVIERVKN